MKEIDRRIELTARSSSKGFTSRHQINDTQIHHRKTIASTQGTMVENKEKGKDRIGEGEEQREGREERRKGRSSILV